MWSFLLAAVAVGILGMHGLTQDRAGSPPTGHHVAQGLDIAPVSETPHSPGASEDSSPDGDAGLLTLCVMVLVPAVAVGLWLLLRSRGGGWRLPRRPVPAMRGLELAVPPQPLWRQLSVLRI